VVGIAGFLPLVLVFVRVALGQGLLDRVGVRVFPGGLEYRLHVGFLRIDLQRILALGDRLVPFAPLEGRLGCAEGRAKSGFLLSRAARACPCWATADIASRAKALP
jgi:hypothetical protein